MCPPIPEYFDYGLKTLSGILIAWPAACLAAWFAIGKFHKEKRWERKEAAFTEIINAMHDLLRYFALHKEDYGQGVDCSDEKMTDLFEKYQQSFWILEKARAIGSLYISDDAMNLLIKFSKREQLALKENPAWDFYEQEFVLCKKAMDDLLLIAKKELHINGKPR